MKCKIVTILLSNSRDTVPASTTCPELFLDTISKDRKQKVIGLQRISNQ